MHLSLHWHGAEGLYTVKSYASLRKKINNIADAACITFWVTSTGYKLPFILLNIVGLTWNVHAA